MCPPSETLSQVRFSDISMPVISRRMQEKLGGCLGSPRLGFAIQNPRRMLRSVIRAERVGYEPSPICGDAAAPDIAMAVARSTGRPFVLQSSVAEYPTALEPLQ